MPEESELSITFGDQFFESIFQINRFAIKPSVKENVVLTTKFKDPTYATSISPAAFSSIELYDLV